MTISRGGQRMVGKKRGSFLLLTPHDESLIHWLLCIDHHKAERTKTDLFYSRRTKQLPKWKGRERRRRNWFSGDDSIFFSHLLLLSFRSPVYLWVQMRDAFWPPNKLGKERKGLPWGKQVFVFFTSLSFLRNTIHISVVSVIRHFSVRRMSQLRLLFFLCVCPDTSQ